jgi:hypothetical protein
MKNSLKPQRVLELENFIQENKKLCTILLNLAEQNQHEWGNILQCMGMNLFTYKDHSVSFDRKFKLPLFIMKTYLTERKKLPLHLKLWT